MQELGFHTLRTGLLQVVVEVPGGQYIMPFCHSVILSPQGYESVTFVAERCLKILNYNPD